MMTIGQRAYPGGPGLRSELVVEPAFAETLPLLGGDLHVGRREQVHAVRHQLDLPVEPEHEARGEVDQPPGDRVVGALQVHDHGDAVAKLVPEVTGLVEALRLGLVNRGTGPAGLWDRAHDVLAVLDGRMSSHALHGADGDGLLPERRIRLHLVHLVVSLFLDEPEVAERLLPHTWHSFLLVVRGHRSDEAPGRDPNSAVPIRTIVAPSSTAIS